MVAFRFFDQLVSVSRLVSQHFSQDLLRKLELHPVVTLQSLNSSCKSLLESISKCYCFFALRQLFKFTHIISAEIIQGRKLFKGGNY